MTYIELKKCFKEFEKDKNKIIAVDNVSYSFCKGKFYGIIGPSGSGKSTLVECIGLLDKFSSGTLIINDKKIDCLNSNELADIRKKHIGFIFQNYFLSSNLNVLQNVMLPLYLYKNIDKKSREAKAIKYLQMVGLEKRITHYPYELSGGEQQRVGIARALVNDADIIIADEPTGNLDIENEKVIMEILKKCSLDGKCVIVVSHSEILKKYADELLMMKNGELKKYE